MLTGDEDLVYYDKNDAILQLLGLQFITAVHLAVLLKKLAAEDPPAFICHFYNVYFAHSAGGRMIGTKMSDMLLDGAKLQFYAYDGEMKDLLQVVKDNLNTVAEVCPVCVCVCVCVCLCGYEKTSRNTHHCGVFLKLKLRASGRAVYTSQLYPLRSYLPPKSEWSHLASTSARLRGGAAGHSQKEREPWSVPRISQPN
jgi:hypothetical protein